VSSTTSFARLFQPIRLGKIEVENRFVLAPMGTYFSTGVNMPRELSISGEVSEVYLVGDCVEPRRIFEATHYQGL